MSMRTKTTAILLGATCLLTLLPRPAAAISYTSNFMTSWDGCETWAAPLTYTDDQIYLFDSKMRSLGHTRLRMFANQDAWASDLVEDRDFGGEDAWYADDGEMFVYSGHGTNDANPWGQSFFAPMCKRGTSGSANYDSELSRLGEQGTSYYAAPNAGNMRTMVWLTCFSVDSQPDQQWGQSFWFGLDMVMGYRGLSADASSTDEVGEDYAIEVYEDGTTFKAGWFYAVEDWWIDDVGSLVASGVDGNSAIWRRENLNRWTPRRPAHEVHTVFTWSWHEG